MAHYTELVPVAAAMELAQTDRIGRGKLSDRGKLELNAIIPTLLDVESQTVANRRLESGEAR